MNYINVNNDINKQATITLDIYKSFDVNYLTKLFGDPLIQ